MKENEKVVLSIGTFDGVHLGHRKVIDKLLEVARQKKLKSVLVCFRNVPKDLIKNTKTKKIYPIDNKLQYLNSYGIDYVIDMDFTQQIRKMSQNEFINSLGFDVEHLVVGHDFHFGYNQEEISSYEFTRVEPLLKNGVVIHSTLIRNMMESGDIENIDEYLGRIYSLSSKVQHGKSIGRKLGFPTINFSFESELALRHGVYISKTLIDNKSYKSISYYGKSPSFDDRGLTFETYIFDFDKNIYDYNVKIEVYKFLRDDIIFKDYNELIRTIQRDIDETKQYFSEGRYVQNWKLHKNVGECNGYKY